MAKITVLDNPIGVYSQHDEDYICLTDMARYKDAKRTDYIIQNWLRNRTTIEFLGVWEHLNNPAFKPIEFDGFRKQAGLNSFVLTAKQWIDKTGAIGLVAKPGRNGGTYAHKDIAFEFASWISVEFKLYLIKEFQRLKDEELKQLGWDIRRNLAKINYRIHTDAIQKNLIPPTLSKAQVNLVYATGSGCSEHGIVRDDGQGMARRQPGSEGQHPGLRRCVAVGVPVEPGEHERPDDPGRHIADGAAGEAE